MPPLHELGLLQHVLVLMHEPLQSNCPLGQPQLPPRPEQTRPPVQLFGLLQQVPAAMQLAPQTVPPELTCVQVPALHVSLVQGLPSLAQALPVSGPCVQLPLPSQVLEVQGLPSSSHAVPAAASLPAMQK
jgi:hypothetical protein